jgi:hypothetical protein
LLLLAREILNSGKILGKILGKIWEKGDTS